MTRFKHFGTKPAALALCGVLLAGAATPALAEQGDYSWWQTVLNLFSPPPADNPVTPEQRQGLYPLLGSASSGGFDPGGYYQWQTVQLGPETGAVCGNGTPYKFFVNRVPNSTNTVIWMEGGGAHWDRYTLENDWAINRDGIPDDYMNRLDKSLVTPFVTRLPVFDWVKTQNWNIIYVPYCTADNYGGDKIALHLDPDGQAAPIVWHYNGLRNMRAITAWLKNNLPRPAQLLTTGCSAGGAGSLVNYHPLRRDMAPDRSFLIGDSGPLFWAPAGADPAQHPSRPLHAKVTTTWGLSGPMQYLGLEMPDLDVRNLGSVYSALSAKYPADRMGQVHFWQDLTLPGFYYPYFFQDEFEGLSPAEREALLHAKFGGETARLRDDLNGLDNFGGYFPQYRDLNSSHCATIVDFRRGDIQEQGTELRHFIDSVLDGQGPVLDASESSDAADKARPADPLYTLLQTLF